MNAQEVILATYASADRVVNAYLADLSDGDLLIRPVSGQNHIAWQLGHLIATEHRLVDAIKPGSCPELPAGFADAHGRDETSTHSDDAGRFASKATYLELMNAQREATKSLITSISEADLDAPAPESMRARFPSTGLVLLLGATHYLMHVGQFVSVRRSIGKPIAI